MKRLHSKTSGFTLVELLVVIGIIALLMGILLPVLSGVQKAAQRTACAANLDQIGKAMLMYANDHGQRFPRTVYAPPSPESATCVPDNTNAGRASANPFTDPAGTRPPDNCVPSAIFWLLRSQNLNPRIFLCPAASSTVPDNFGGGTNSAVNTGNFQDIQANLSYSMADPYPGNLGEGALFKWGNSMGPGTAIVADMNPGPFTVVADPQVNPSAPSPRVTSASNATQVRYANSPNHDRTGENVLYADGHVAWSITPLCGETIRGKADNIYCRNGIGSAGNPELDTVANTYLGPACAEDSVLLPTFLP